MSLRRAGEEPPGAVRKPDASGTLLSQRGTAGRVARALGSVGILGAENNISFVPASTHGQEGRAARRRLAWAGRMRQEQICVTISILRVPPDLSKI